MCVCRCGHQGGEQDHRAGELSSLLSGPRALVLGSVSPARTHGRSVLNVSSCATLFADRPITHTLDTSAVH